MVKSDIILVRTADKAMGSLKQIGACQHPMNLVYLASALRSCGHHSVIVDLEVVPSSYLEEQLRAVRPYLVGITAMTPNIPEAKRICALCRSLGIKTVLGGVHPTILPIQTLQDTDCDYVVVGEGEKAICEILESIKKNQPVNNIKGIAFLQNNNPVVNEPQLLLDLNEFPLPDRRFLALNLYKGELTPGVIGRAATIFTSRGCPFNCTFCASKAVNQQRIRFRAMEKIFEEIDDIVALGFTHITVDDNTFTIDRQRVKEFCLYLLSKYPRISWDCDSRVDALDDEILQLMKKSNCKKIALGVESGSARILESINKQIDVNRVKDVFGLIKKYAILTQAFFMIGFPDETMEEIKLTENLILNLKLDFLCLSVVVPYPGTVIYDIMIEKGHLTSKSWDKFLFFGENIPWRTEYFSGKDLVRIRKKISSKFYFRLPYIYKKLLTVRNKEMLCYFVRGGIAAFKSFLCNSKNT